MGSGLPRGVKKGSGVTNCGIRIADCGFLKTKKEEPGVQGKSPKARFISLIDSILSIG